MFKILVDTCVWLDLAKDPKQRPVLGVVEELVKRRLVSLVVPRIVLDEFGRNRDRIAKDSAKSLSTHFRVVKEAVGRAGGSKRRMKAVLAHLEDVDHKVPLIGGEANGVLDRIEHLLTAAQAVEATDEAKIRAAQRAIDKRAPFHQGKNSMADAMLIEIYADCLKEHTAGVRFAFITHNRADFSTPKGDQRLPHPDMAHLFSRIRSLYSINLAEVLRRVAPPGLVTEVMVKHSWAEEPRALSDIVAAEDLLFHQVWYNRHWNLRIGVREGRIKVVDKETYPVHCGGPEETILREVWKDAREAARRVEKKYGKKNLGPWSDFEWGMINGKLSALRWVLGSEWDFLDT